MDNEPRDVVTTEEHNFDTLVECDITDEKGRVLYTVIRATWTVNELIHGLEHVVSDEELRLYKCRSSAIDWIVASLYRIKKRETQCATN